MIIDAQTAFSSSQVLTETAASTNYIDLSAARNLGAGEEVKILVHVSAVSGTSPTLKVDFEVDDNTSFSSATAVDTTGTLSPPVASTIYRMRIPSHTKERYVRMNYTVGGTTPSITVTAALVLDENIPNS